MQKVIYVVLFTMTVQNAETKAVDLNKYTAITLSRESIKELSAINNKVLSTSKAKEQIGQGGVNELKKIKGMIDTTGGSQHQIFHISLDKNVRELISKKYDSKRLNKILPKILFCINDVQQLDIKDWGRFIALHINDWKPKEKLEENETKLMNEVMEVVNGGLHVSINKTQFYKNIKIKNENINEEKISKEELHNNFNNSLKLYWLDTYKDIFRDLYGNNSQCKFTISMEKLTNNTGLE
jgi:hypothetical protein